MTSVQRAACSSAPGSDGTAEPIGHDLPRTNHDASLLVVQVLFGWVATSAQIISALEPGHYGSSSKDAG